LVAAILFASMMEISLRVLNAANRPSLSLVTSVGALVFAVIAQSLMIPRFGLMGAAGAAAVTFVMGAFVGLGLVFLFFRVTLSPGTVLRCLVAGGVVGLGGAFWPAQGPWVLAKLAVLSAAYAVLLLISGELRRDDFRLLRPSRGQNPTKPA